MDISENLVEQICSGDEAAYEEFVRTCWPHAVRTGWLILRNVHDAEESAQESFLKLYNSRSDIRSPDKFRTWFYRILVNSAKDKLRRRKVVVNLDDVAVPTTANAMHHVELRLAVQDAIDRLSPEERIAIVLCHFNGLSETEAAQAAGWNLGKYKYRLLRARKNLSKWMGDDVVDTSVGGKQREGINHA